MNFVSWVIVLEEVISRDGVYKMRFNKRENLRILLKISSLFESNLINVDKVVNITVWEGLPQNILFCIYSAMLNHLSTCISWYLSSCLVEQGNHLMQS